MKLRPEEITSVLKSRIQQYEAGIDIQEVGTVVQVGDGVARIQGLENAVASEMLELPHGVTGLVLNLEEDSVGAIIFGESHAIKEGDEVVFELEEDAMKIKKVEKRSLLKLGGIAKGRAIGRGDERDYAKKAVSQRIVKSGA